MQMNIQVLSTEDGLYEFYLLVIITNTSIIIISINLSTPHNPSLSSLKNTPFFLGLATNLLGAKKLKEAIIGHYVSFIFEFKYLSDNFSVIYATYINF